MGERSVAIELIPGVYVQAMRNKSSAMRNNNTYIYKTIQYIHSDIYIYNYIYIFIICIHMNAIIIRSVVPEFDSYVEAKWLGN
jgi:hypothetical protein